jgi:hypothetical protein
MSDLVISRSDASGPVGCDISVTVQNAGSQKGSEVVQVYVTYPKTGISASMPLKQLRGFTKVGRRIRAHVATC